MESVENYAQSWAKQEDEELDTLTEWVKSIKHQLKRRIYMVSRSVNTKPISIFNDEVVSRLIFMTALLSSQQISVLTMSSFVRHIITVNLITKGTNR